MAILINERHFLRFREKMKEMHEKGETSVLSYELDGPGTHCYTTDVGLLKDFSSRVTLNISYLDEDGFRVIYKIPLAFVLGKHALSFLKTSILLEEDALDWDAKKENLRIIFYKTMSRYLDTTKIEEPLSRMILGLLQLKYDLASLNLIGNYPYEIYIRDLKEFPIKIIDLMGIVESWEYFILDQEE